MRDKVLHFLKDENGQTSTEYILLVVVVAFIIFKFKGQLETKLLNSTGNVFDKVDTLIQSIQ